MYCSNCGKQLADNAKFCYNCGAAQEIPPVQQPQQAQQPQQMQLETVCPNCGVPFEGNSSFCVKCGTKRSMKPQPAASQYAQQTVPPQYYYTASQQGYAPAANMNAAVASSGGRFLAWVPLIMAAIATVLAVYYDLSTFLQYFNGIVDYFVSQGIVYCIAIISPLVVPVLCAVSGMMKKRSQAFCVVVAVFAGVSLLMQIIMNAVYFINGYEFIYKLPNIAVRLSQLISGQSTVWLVVDIARYGIVPRLILVLLANVLFVAKNIMALVASGVMAAKAKK